MDPVTIKSYFDKFKVVLTHAAKKDHLLDIRDVESWFEDVKISRTKEEDQHLEIKEIHQLNKLKFASINLAWRGTATCNNH